MARSGALHKKSIKELATLQNRSRCLFVQSSALALFQKTKKGRQN